MLRDGSLISALLERRKNYIEGVYYIYEKPPREERGKYLRVSRDPYSLRMHHRLLIFRFTCEFREEFKVDPFSARARKYRGTNDAFNSH